MCYIEFLRKAKFSEKYLDMSPFTRRRICKFRTTNHRLQIEVGRYANLPRHTRLCDKCKLSNAGDEVHFLFGCPELQDNPSVLKVESLMTCVNIFMLKKNWQNALVEDVIS